MRAITRRLAAVAFSPWVFLNHRAGGYGVGLAFIPSSGASLTGRVEHTFDHPHVKSPVRITRSGTTATLLKVNHGLSVDDYLVVEHAGAPFDGEFSVASVVDADNVTYTVVDSGLTVSAPLAQAGSARVFAHEDLADLTARADGNYAYPAVACRLRLTVYASGFAELAVMQTT